MTEMPFETRLNRICGLMEALNALVEGEASREGIDAVRFSLQDEIEALYGQFERAFYKGEGLTPKVWPTISPPRPGQRAA